MEITFSNLERKLSLIREQSEAQYRRLINILHLSKNRKKEVFDLYAFRDASGRVWIEDALVHRIDGTCVPVRYRVYRPSRIDAFIASLFSFLRRETAVSPPAFGSIQATDPDRDFWAWRRRQPHERNRNYERSLEDQKDELDRKVQEIDRLLSTLPEHQEEVTQLITESYCKDPRRHPFRRHFFVMTLLLSWRQNEIISDNGLEWASQHLLEAIDACIKTE